MNKNLINTVLLLFACMIWTSSGVEKQNVYSPTPAEKAVWDKLLQQGVEKIVFVKRYTYNSNHYYTEYLNSQWMPGGNLCLLSLRSGEVTDLAPQLEGGVFGAFDVSFDAKRIVFAYKASDKIGYRIYEVGVDGKNLRQLTFSPENEEDIINTYNVGGYIHGTEDLDPCYLPDGGICFISTRCHFGILCDAPDIFDTTVLYRIDADGSNMRQLTNSSVSENTPAVLPDGRILYTRWEYVDKGAVSVKCLWAMNPDGSNSSEIFGNDVAYPPTMIMARPIPGSPSEYVFTGTPHCCPQNCVGTIIRIDVSKDIRTRAPMTYITPYTDVRFEHGTAFRDSKDTTRWYHDASGSGPLFRESYPLSRTEFLTAHKPAGSPWNNPKGYKLFLLHEGGAVEPIYADTAISCFHPMPLVARKIPPVIPERKNQALADKNLAECIVTDVYKGLTDVPKGAVKYLRILEQVPRPWGARRFYHPDYMKDEYDQQHVVISKDTHLGLKIQHGIVNVEKDGSARFTVPAGRNIFFQALDKYYRAVQTERTYVNYMPGEIRSCTGCHEPSSQTPSGINGKQTPLAMKRDAETPFAQPGDVSASRTLSYARDVQPVWDRSCVRCHNSEQAAGGLNLSGRETRLFNESYECLVPERRKGGGGTVLQLTEEQRNMSGHEYYMDDKSTYHKTDMPDDPHYTTEGRGFYVSSGGYGFQKVSDRNLLGPVIGENHPKNGNISYLPPKSLGSYTSVLVAMFCPDIKLADAEAQQRAEALAKKHEMCKLTPEEILKITNWVDTNCQYYGTYYGRRDSMFREHPDYRKEYDADVAVSPYPPMQYK